MIGLFICFMLLTSFMAQFPAQVNDVVILDDPQYFIEDETWDNYEGNQCSGCPYCWYRDVFLPWMEQYGEENDP